MNILQRIIICLRNKFIKYQRLPITSGDWAEAILYISKLKYNYELNCTECNKYLYLLYGVELARRDLLICDTPRLWPFGPVFPQARLVCLSNDGLGADKYKEIAFTYPELMEDAEKILRMLLSKHLINRLVEWSMEIHGPWWYAITDGKDWNTTITNKRIKEYFSKNLKIIM